MIHVQGFHIVSPGDNSVGIFEANWTLTGDFYFEDKQELEAFRTRLKDVFEFYVADPIGLETFEESDARSEAENKMYDRD